MRIEKRSDCDAAMISALFGKVITMKGKVSGKSEGFNLPFFGAGVAFYRLRERDLFLKQRSE